MTRARLVAAVLSSVAVGVVGCGGSSGTAGGGGTPAAKNIKISGTLSPGSVASALTSGAGALSTSAALNAFAGYKLYCVTFSAAPVSARAAADAAGAVSLTLAAELVPFGCFILDAADKNVATLMFKMGAEKDQAIAFANDTDLGTITVDVTAGIAQAAPAVGSLATTLPSGLQCPVGKWASDIFDPGVDPGPPSFTCLRSTYDQIIVLDPNGSLMMSHEAFDTFVPAPNDPAARVCGDMALPAQSVTFANGTLSYSFSDDPYSCPGKVAHVTATFNADCTVATANYQSTGCGECVAGSMGNDGCRGCGGVTCSTTTTPGASALILHKR